MKKTTKHVLLPGALAVGVALVAIHAHSTELGIDWGRKDGIDVPAGQSVVQTDAIRVSDGGTFVKVGDGTLSLPLGKLDSVADVSVEVRAGRLEIEPGAPQGGAVSAPSVIADKAAFWVDADATSSLVLNGSVVTRWCDRREADTASPTRYNARPATASNAGTAEIDQTLVATNGRNAVFFGGYNAPNKRFMQFYKGEAESEIVYIRHAFVVFGAIDCYSGPIGCKQNPDDWFSAASIAKMTDAPKYFGIRYGEASPGAFTARHYLDGVRFDPWSTEVKRGFQLWETQFPEYTGTAGNFFNHKNAAKRQGGDYLCEAILFTNDLQAVERLQVQEYLMAKWGLGGEARLSRGVAVTLAPGAVIGLSNADSLEFPTSAVTRMEGVGTFQKTGSGELSLDHRALDVRDFEGEFDLADGSVFVRRGSVPALKLAGGDAVSFGAIGKSGAAMNSVADYERYGFSLTKTPGGVAANRIEKSGAEEIRVHSIPDGVERLDIKAGDFALVATTTGNLVGDGAIFATIPNADFEEPFSADSSYNRKKLSESTAVNHWFKSGGGMTAYIAEDNSPGDTGTENPHRRSKMCPYPVRQGFNVLSIANKDSAYTTEAVFPKSGYYEMTVLESSRYHHSDIAEGNDLANPGYDVMIGDSWATAVAVARRAVANAGNFAEVTIPLGYVEAGTKTFGFKGPQWSKDSTLLLDDIKVRFVADRQPLGRVEIPNGDFESVTNRAIAASVTSNQAMYPARTNANEAACWTFDNSNAAVPAAAVVAAYCSPSSSTLTGSAYSNKELMPYGDMADGLAGSFHLSLCGNTGSARTTFVVPAGTYRLKGRVAQWGGKHNGTNFRNERPSVSATVTAGGQTTALGSVATADHRMLEYAWPNLLTVPSAGTVELSLAAGAAADALLIDDLVLENVAGGDGAEEELVANGSFETQDGAASLDGWKTLAPTFGTAGVTVADPQDDAVNHPSYNTAAQFGQTPYDGVAYVRIYNDGGIYQALTLDPGLYRLSFATHSRANPGYDKNPIRAWLGDSSGNLVAGIGETKVGSVADIEHVWHFRVASRGSYRLYLQGTDHWAGQFASDGKNHCTVLDGVSLKKVRDELVAPALPETLKIVVFEGARLRLDFDGTVDVGRLVLGGSGVHGTVSAATHPDFIQGRGVLNVTGKGEPATTVIFR